MRLRLNVTAWKLDSPVLHTLRRPIKFNQSDNHCTLANISKTSMKGHSEELLNSEQFVQNLKMCLPCRLFICAQPQTFKSVTLLECYSTAVLIYSSPSIFPPSCSISLATFPSLPCYPILPFPRVCLMDWCYYRDLLHASVFKRGRWLYLSSFSMLKSCPGLCGAELAVWRQRGGDKWARLASLSQAVNMWHAERFNKSQQKHSLWSVNQNIIEMKRGDDLNTCTSLKKKKVKRHQTKLWTIKNHFRPQEATLESN